MELSHEFCVKAPLDEAWKLLTDLPRIAPCLPGFELQGVDGDQYRGVVRVKVGPMTAQYAGVASFQQRDEAQHRAVVRAEGRDPRGQGTASAIVTATLAPADGGTRVSLHTDLKITGRLAQFGRGVLAEVSNQLLGEFARALEADLGPRAATAAAAATPAAGGSQPVDVLWALGPTLRRRAVPIALLLAAAFWLLRSC